MHPFDFAAADPDYYEPLEAGPADQPYLPAKPPAGWTRHASGPWMMWMPPDATLPDQGWKVHVSSSLGNVQRVLDIVTRTCAELAVPFKHLAAERFFLVLHEKQADRVQSG